MLNIGCAVQDWQVAGRRVVLGYADREVYRENPGSLGAVVGRLANRTGFGRFEMDGQTYHLPVAPGAQHSAHGGPRGLGKQIWQMEQECESAVVLRLRSPDGQAGYPGNVDFTVRMTLRDHALTWDMTATPDRTTPIALCQHVYFNLACESVRDHRLRVAAKAFTPVDDTLLPTGEILPVAGTRNDFRTGVRLSDNDPAGLGYDVNLALANGDGVKAEVQANDLRLRLWTDQAGLQIYTAGNLKQAAEPLPGQQLGPWSGLCLEAQAFPNTVNTPGFGSVLCTPDAPYRQVTKVEIKPS